MRPETLALLRSNRPAHVALGVAVLLALIVTARLIDSHSAKPVITAKPIAAAAASEVPAKAALAPNETLVVPAAAPTEPLMPHYGKPEPPPPAPPLPDQPQSPAAVSAEAQAAMAEQRIASSVASMPPLQQPAPAPALAAAPAPQASRASCAGCGEVIAVTIWPDVAEIRARLQDGSVHTFRGPVPAPWHVGDRVRSEGGRLVRD